jgi:hypothetical protein
MFENAYKNCKAPVTSHTGLSRLHSIEPRMTRISRMGSEKFQDNPCRRITHQMVNFLYGFLPLIKVLGISVIREIRG